MAEMTRDELRELRARAMCAVDCNETPPGLCDDCDEWDVYLRMADDTMKAEDAAGLAVVPKEANDNRKIVEAGQEEYRHKLPYRTLYNVMVHVGNLLKVKE